MRNTPQSTGIANAKVTSISLTGEDTVAFYNGTQLLRVFGQVRNIAISRDRQYIVITELDESIFSFDVWHLSQITSVAYSPLNKFASNIQELYAARMDTIYYTIASRLFRGCCCSTPGPESTPVSFLYEYNDEFSTADWYYASGVLFMSPQAVDGQYLGDLLSVLPDGSWISFMDRDDAQNYVVFEVSDYAIFSGVITYTASVVSGSSVGFALETIYITSFDKSAAGGGGGSVESVTGDSVDNTDPDNPVVNAIPYDASLQNTNITGNFSVDPAAGETHTLTNSGAVVFRTIQDGVILDSVVDGGGNEAISSQDASANTLELNSSTGEQGVTGSINDGTGIISSRIEANDGAGGNLAKVEVFKDAVNVHTPAIQAATAVNGQVLTLIDNTTGKGEWQNSGGGLTWSVETVDRNLVVNEGVIANKATLLNLNLPAAAALGNIIEVVGINAGLWRITQNASQSIRFGSSVSTVGTGGAIASTLANDSIRMVCTATNTTWQVVSAVGNITVV